MPVTLTCANGHQTTVADNSPGHPTCAECGLPLLSDKTTISQPAAETRSLPATPKRAVGPKTTTSRGKQLGLIGGGIVALVGVIVGGYLLFGSRDAVRDPAKDREDARKTVLRFMELSKEGGDEGFLMPLFTDKAAQFFQKGENLPEIPKTRPGQIVEVGEAVVKEDTAEVPVTIKEAGDEERTVFLIRRQKSEWKIYGLSAEFEPGNAASRLTFDFENPQALAKDIFGLDPEQMGKDMMKNMDEAFKKGMTDAFKPDAKSADLDNEALSPMSREAFEATWKTDLDVKDKPAGEILKELASALGAELESAPVQERTLARPVTVQLKGRARLELVEEVSKRVGLSPVWKEKATATKLISMLTFRPAPQPRPVAYAGPFMIEVQELNEYVPHAAGQLVVRVSAPSLPPVVAKAINSATFQKPVLFTEVKDARGNDLSALTNGEPKFQGGRVLDTGYDRNFEVGLRNLLRDVTTIKTIRGRIQISLPTKVDQLRFDPPTAGAVVKSGTAEVTLTGLRKDSTTFEGQKFPNAQVKLKYKGIRPDRVRVLAYDAQKKLLAVSGNSWSGTDNETNAECTIQGEPAAIVVKVMSVIEEVDYPFAFDDLPLTGAAGMPEKITPAAFAGHDAPVTVEFVRVVNSGNFSSCQFKVTNHSDKAVRLLDMKFTYLDATGKKAGEWFSSTCPQPGQLNQKGTLTLVVGKNATAVIDAQTPFLPANATTVQAALNKVVFADAEEWTPKK